MPEARRSVMRRDCSHYFRRTAHGIEAVEGCALGAAPDAPRRCPADCPYFEKRKLSTAGFVYGSLAPEVPDDDDLEQGELESTPEAQAALAELEQFVESIGPAILATTHNPRPRRRGFWSRLFGRND